MINQDLKVKAWKDEFKDIDGEKYVIMDLNSAYPRLYLKSNLSEVEDYFNLCVSPKDAEQHLVFKIKEVCEIQKTKFKIKKTDV